MKRRAGLVGAFALLFVMSAAPGQAQTPAQPPQVGRLTCNVSGSVGMILTSQKSMVCTFRNTRGVRETYTGVIRRFGLDIGATAGGRIFGPSSRRAAFRAALLPEPTPAVRPRRRSEPVWVRTSWSAAPTDRSRCSRYPSAGRPD